MAFDYALGLRNRREEDREYDANVKKEAIDAYGRFCACCGESKIEFLEIDHIFGRGKEHRADLKVSIHRWLRQGRFRRVGFRVLCANCNNSYGHYKYCPHQSNKGMLSKFPKVLCIYYDLRDSQAEERTKFINLTSDEWSGVSKIISQLGYGHISHIEETPDGRRYAVLNGISPRILL